MWLQQPVSTVKLIRICEPLFQQDTFNGRLPFPQAFACDSAWLYSFFFFLPAKASFVATANDATSITATAANIAKVLYMISYYFVRQK